MNRMKKRSKMLSLLLAAVMAGTLAAGCGNTTTSTVETAATQGGTETAAETEQQKTAGAEQTEEQQASERPTYPSDITATGTEADVYNENMENLKEFFGEYYASTGELEKVAGYDEPVSVKTTIYYDVNLQDAYAKFSGKYGETMEKSRWIDAIKQIYNVDAEIAWMAQGTDYAQKLRLDMAANDLPDIFMVQDQSDVVELAEAGQIWDLTDLIDQYGTEEMKDIYESDGGIAMDKVTVDDRVYGLPIKLSDTDNFSYLWLRKDWMDKLNLEIPNTMEELTAVIDAFVNADFDGNGQKDTVGIVVDKDLWYTTRGIFNAYGAYPENWIKTEDDQLEYGGISEANKDALSCLADWYQKGYISSEFITQDNTTAMESVMSGHCGVLYGGHWIVQNIVGLHDLDPESDWIAVAPPSGNGEEVRSPLTSNSTWVVVNSQYDHPEIAFKIQALTRAAMSSEKAAWWMFEENVSWQSCPVRNSVSAMDNLNTYKNLMEVYNNNEDTSLLKGKAIVYWANLHGDGQWEWERMFGPGEHAAAKVLEEASDGGRLFYDAYYGIQSTYMRDRLPAIKDEQLIAFTKMINGELSVEEGFEQWKETFSSLGGDEITQEVNEWYQGQQ